MGGGNEVTSVPGPPSWRILGIPLRSDADYLTDVKRNSGAVLQRREVSDVQALLKESTG